MTHFRPSRLLPVLTGHGGRSAMTCQYRCGNACSHPAPNTSDNPYFGDIASEVSRRVCCGPVPSAPSLSA